MTKSRDVETMRKIFAEKGYNLLSLLYKNNKQPLIFEKNGYYFVNTYNGFIKTDNPKKWGINNPFSLYNLQKYIYEQGWDCKIISQQYDYEKITLLCACGNTYTISLHNLITSQQYRCPKCGRKRMVIAHTKQDYLETFSKYGLTIIGEYKNVKEHVDCITRDGYKIRVSEYNLRNYGKRLLPFHSSNPYTIENIHHYIKANNIPCTLVSTEYINHDTPIELKCICGNIYTSTWDLLQRGINEYCPACSVKISRLEEKTVSWLEEHDIRYYREYKFEDCKDKRVLPFDFYLPDYQICIECQGIQHYKNVGFFKNQYKYVKFHDEIKQKYCQINGIIYLDIPYTAYETDEYEDILSQIILAED